MDPLALLGRKDKWFLGGGKGAIYAPPFPKFLLAPGFWDECFFADVQIPRLFTVLFADEDGRPIQFDSYHKGWRPDRLTVMHTSGDVVLREIRTITEGNAWVSEIELVTAVRPIHVFLWSLLPLAESGKGAPWSSLTDLSVEDDSILAQFSTAWPAELAPDRSAIEGASGQGGSGMLAAESLFLAFGASHPRQSWTVNLAQAHDLSPRHELSVLPEKFVRGRLAGDFKLMVGTPPIEGLVHSVQHYLLEDRRPIQLVCGVGLTPDFARSSMREAVVDGAVARSTEAYRAFFGSVPQFESSDPFLNSAYWNRWYGIRLNTVDVPELPISGSGGAKFGPFITEGVGFFRNFVTYSAQAHLREVGWMHDPRLAQGILDNLDRVQREDGSFPGHNYSGRPSRDFYHSDYATGTRQLMRLHPGSVGREHLAALRRYSEYFLLQRTQSADPFSVALYDVFDQNETGQEYMSRYQFASQDADRWSQFRVAGVDATVYMVQLFEFLNEMRLADGRHGQLAKAARRGLDEVAFDPEAGFYCDVLAGEKRSPARPATGLYPLMLSGLSLDRKQAVITRWMQDEGEFWLKSGFPATAKSDGTFSAGGEWNGRRLNCPWNGRSWPMANSHLVDGLASAYREGISDARAGDALLKAIRLMFHDGNPRRPNSYEHYDPISGVPALYRGYDDYMHSWVVDLILRHAMGIQPGSLEVDPIPVDVDWLEVSSVRNAGAWQDVRVVRGEVAKVDLRPV